ncbi:hypothetical protein ABZ260_25720 [Streptosporangium sp. NPDC006013]
MGLDVQALDRLPAQTESPLYPCDITCRSYRSCATFTCGSTDH